MRKTLTTLVLAIACLASSALAEDVTVGDIKISSAWTRVTPPGARVAGGFLAITNTGKESDRLIGGTATIAGHIEVHEMSMQNGVMKMQELASGLEIKPGETVVLKPGSFHVMFMDLKSAPVEGSPVKGTLKFEKAGEVEISYAVVPLGAKSIDGDSAAGTMQHGDHEMKEHGQHHGH